MFRHGFKRIMSQWEEEGGEVQQQEAPVESSGLLKLSLWTIPKIPSIVDNGGVMVASSLYYETLQPTRRREAMEVSSLSPQYLSLPLILLF